MIGKRPDFSKLCEEAKKRDATVELLVSDTILHKPRDPTVQYRCLERIVVRKGCKRLANVQVAADVDAAARKALLQLGFTGEGH